MATENQLKTQLYDIYIRGCETSGEILGFYYGEAEETGLLAVYQAGIEAGREQ